MNWYYRFLVFGVMFFLIISCDTDQIKRDRFFLIGNEALENRDFKKAIDSYTKSIELDPAFYKAWNNRGVAYLEDDQPYLAIQDYTSAINLQQDYWDAIFNRSYAYERVNKIDKALADLSFILTNYPDSAYVHFYQGLLLTKERNYDRAISSFIRSLELDSLNPETYVNLATLYLFKNELADAEKWASKAVRMNPNEANALNTLSQIQLRESRYQEALNTINRALTIVPLEPYFLNNRGFIYLEIDSLESAVRDINRSILLDPNNAWAYRNKGIYFLRSKKYDRSIELLEQALQREEFLDEIHSYLGKAYFAKGLKEIACEQWRIGQTKNEWTCESLIDSHCL